MKKLIYIKKPSSHKTNFLMSELKKTELSNDVNCLFSENLDELSNKYKPKILISNIFNKDIYTKFPEIEHLIVPTSGLDGVDINLLTKKNIKFYQNSQIFSKTVVTSLHKYLKNIQNKFFGLYGFGNIGSGIYKYLSKTNTFLIYEKNEQNNISTYKNVVYFGTSLNKVIENSEIHIISLPKNSETINLFSKEVLNNINKNSELISISRKELIDEEGLIESINKGNLSNVKLDSYSSAFADFAKKSKYVNLNNHMSGITKKSIEKMVNWILIQNQKINYQNGQKISRFTK